MHFLKHLLFLLSVTVLRSYLSATTDEIFLDSLCEPATGIRQSTNEWGLCGKEDTRAKVLKQSTFTLIPAVGAANPVIGARLYEALKVASIPVLIGDIEMPYAEV